MKNLLWKIRSFHQMNVFELNAIFRLRQEVFVVEQNCAYLDADGKDQFSEHIFGVDDDGRVLAYCRIVQPSVTVPDVSIGRIATHTDVRGTGLGKILMEKAMAFIDDRYGKVSIRLEAQQYLLRFYENYGFVVNSDTYILDGIEHVEMLRNVEKVMINF
ncbi:MAG: GNAT family N-acetyltransferase [Bacteroidetes bacterium]|nr:GNAT family N-acetyltransferase [Bacteroidota bacterium]